MAGFIGEGTILIDRDMNKKYVRVANAPSFIIDETDSEVKVRYSKARDTYGQALDRLALPRPAKISMVWDDIDVETLAIALRGLVDTDTDSGTVSDEVVVAALEYWIDLEHRNISDVVVTDQNGTTTYVLDIDYKINPRLGMIYCLPGGSITEGETLKVSYTYAPLSNRIIRASRVAEIECAIKFDGKNRVTGKDCIIEAPWAKLSPKSPVDFLSDDFTKLELEGLLLTAPGYTEPYIVLPVE
ncbi:hypothetical protein [Thermodesulforhabdus norvegica]|uniref:Uncharacterized protein n=1 Tax=Thermodesulforhabdus norvegica TaxID=39841 RepID=A0A1I4SV54_9BACT|nr:hypothetical protein [Thermodesulforhabdus norvegica]SFM68311.1 hypothetical protein SAMN05660836_01181 [Thermodesulforhabdus norvegica]